MYAHNYCVCGMLDSANVFSISIYVSYKIIINCVCKLQMLAHYNTLLLCTLHRTKIGLCFSKFYI